MRTQLEYQRPQCWIWGELEEVECEPRVLGCLVTQKPQKEGHESSHVLEWCCHQSYTAVTSTSPMDLARAAPGLSVVEKNQVSRLIKSSGHTLMKISLSMVSGCLHMMAH